MRAAFKFGVRSREAIAATNPARSRLNVKLLRAKRITAAIGSLFAGGSNALHRQRDALADADAHGGERALAVAFLQAVHRGQRQSRPGHAERMAERNSTAVRIDVV